MAEKKDFKYLVRIMNTDLDGNKDVFTALTKIKGVSYSISNALCNVAGVKRGLKTGKLTDAEVSKINDILKEPVKFNIPSWMVNRRNDPETGETVHLCVSDLQFTKENDLKTLKKTKSYRGMRHAWGLTTRGQRTKSNFRRTKSKGRASLGVQRKGKRKGRV